MAFVSTSGASGGVGVPPSQLGTALTDLLLADDILPGTDPGYETCKAIYLWHTLGQKIAESPVRMAMFRDREITITGEAPEKELKDAFNEQWEVDGCNRTILSFAVQARVYGIATLVVKDGGGDWSKPLDLSNIENTDLVYNVFDPLNTAGSLVLSQDPNAMDYQNFGDVRVSGQVYHRSRSVVIMNESPIYIAYSPSTYGFSGRSVYQRVLFPLKSFIQTQYADDMVARKVGLLIAKIKPAGSFVDAIMTAAAAFKRWILKIGGTDNVVNIEPDEEVESLNLQNLNAPLAQCRQDILENIASGVPMPAIILKQETYAQGFGEGSQDAYAVAGHLEEIRRWMRPAYRFMDMLTQRRAWGPKFFKTMLDKYPEQYAGMNYDTAFYQWTNSFQAKWPELIQEARSERVNVEDTKLKSAMGGFQLLMQLVDVGNKVKIIDWLCEQFNSAQELFSGNLTLDMDELEMFLQKQQEQQEQQIALGQQPGFSSKEEGEEGAKVAKPPPPPTGGAGVAKDAATSYLNSPAPFGPGPNGSAADKIAHLQRMMSRIKGVA
jgi:hypothetical protein